jgi:hypothetical protein
MRYETLKSRPKLGLPGWYQENNLGYSLVKQIEFLMGFIDGSTALSTRINHMALG